MTTSELTTLAEQYSEETMPRDFETLPNKRSNRADLHAFLLLDELCPGKTDIISSAGHDEFWLDIDVEELAKVITPEQVRELAICCVNIGSEGLWMFA